MIAQTLIDRTLPFLGGVVILLIGAHFHIPEATILGLIVTAYGVWHMIRSSRS